MGTPKQLLPLRGKPALRRTIEALVQGGITRAVAVLPPESPEMENVLAGLPVILVHNAIPRSEMADSVRIGLSEVGSGATGVLIAPADHPLVSAGTVHTLCTLHRSIPGRILMPTYGGRRGHPTLFPQSLLRGLSPGLTLRDVLRQNAGDVQAVDVPDEGVVLDMDTPADYERLKTLARSA